MEKKDRIRLAIETYFQCQLSETISDNELEVLLQNQKTKEEKFILLSLCYKLDNPLFGLDKIEELLGIKIPSYEEEMFKRLTSFSKDELFVVSISAWLKNKISPQAVVLVICALKRQKDDGKLKILNSMFDLYFKNENHVQFLSRCFHSVVENIPSPSYRLPLLNMLIGMILRVDEKGKCIIALYRYYSYVNEYEIVDMLSTFITSLGIDYTQDFYWPWCDNDLIKERYLKIVAAKKDSSERRSDVLDHLSTNLENSPASSLIPLVLYSRKMNDIENESWVMRFVWKKLSTPGIISRLSELCGFTLPKEALSLKHEARGPWFTRRINEAHAISTGQKAVTRESILSVKKAYTIQPFNPSIINGLIAVSAKNNDQDIGKMLNTSINGISSYIFLGKALIHSIQVGSQSAVFILLKRLASLKIYETILFAVESINFYSARNNLNSMKSIRICLDFYNQITPKHEKNNFRATKLRENYYGIDYDKEAFSRIKITFDNEQKTVELYDRKSYDELFEILSKKNFSVETVKVVLKAAIDLKSPMRILEAYEILVGLDPMAASFYNSEVEPFIIIRNKYSKPTWSSRGLVSSIWGVPANFSEPIDRKSGLLSGKVN